jgi:hypothetical protein
MVMRTLTRGLIAGAAGTATLNLVTYLDVAVRGRAPSSAPEESVRRLADRADIKIGDTDTAKNRVTGLGALLGFATGLGAAAGYALVAGDRLPRPVTALALTALALVGSNAPMTALGVSDPRQWTASEWISDLVPHLAYGTVAATAYHALGAAGWARRGGAS